MVDKKQNLTWIDVTLPHGKAPRALTQWRVGDVTVKLPQLDECGFLGALVHGAYSEQIEARITIKVAHASTKKGSVTLPSRVTEEKTTMPFTTKAKKQTFVTEFDLPFIESFGCEPGYADDTVIELAFIDPAKVDTLSARLNGQAIKVRRYHYPREKKYFSYYIELTGQTEPGRMTLELDVCWK